jgi:hypothetical protein
VAFGSAGVMVMTTKALTCSNSSPLTAASISVEAWAVTQRQGQLPGLLAPFPTVCWSSLCFFHLWNQ